jgi:hypothetical protein
VIVMVGATTARLTTVVAVEPSPSDTDGTL